MFTGSQHLTASGVIGTSGKPTRIFSLHIASTASAGYVKLRSGKDATGTEWYQKTGTANVGVTDNIEGGMYFPNGCYAFLDGAMSYLTVQYYTEV